MRRPTGLRKALANQAILPFEGGKLVPAIFEGINAIAVMGSVVGRCLQ